MAHRFSIPIEFSCEMELSNWTVGVAHPVKWWLGYGDWALEMKVTRPPRFAGSTQYVSAQDIPANLSALLPAEGERLTKEARKAELEVLIGSHELVVPHRRKVDPWALRRDFLALDGSTAGLSDFLNHYGPWDRGATPRYSSSKSGFFWEPVIVVPLRIWRDRERIKSALTAGASAWFSSPSVGVSLHARPEFPHYHHRDAFCEGAINMAITVDFLRRVKFRICPRVDCGRPFPAERQGKIYCSQYCAHLVSLRKTRKIQQALRRKEKH